jgi:16S rRNA (cytidine1402-2'-O)-methyltransferase
MALAGIEAPGFVFGGFLPARPVSARRAALDALLSAAGAVRLPLVLYEAPHRVVGLLDLLAEVAAGLPVVACRELTKRHEQVLAGTPAEVRAALSEVRGEFTLVVGAPEADAPAAGLDAAALATAALAAGIAPRTVADLLRAGGLSRREAYALAQGR